jgi:Family of unknown function (DUF6516)
MKCLCSTELYGTKYHMADAKLLFHRKEDYDDGHIAELTIWLLPESTSERPHGLKYSLFYGREGERIIGYDNERGKGDHRHYGAVEEKYEFRSVRQLIVDFTSDVAKVRRSR